jgi:hypothetical protein
MSQFVILKSILNKVDRVEVYKIDLFTCDEFRIDLFGNDEHLLVISEDEPGWDECILRLEQLDGFAKNWYGSVMQPAFVENRHVVWEQASN